MGRGIAVVFAYAGHQVSIIDFKARDATAFAQLVTDTLAEVSETLTSLAGLGLFDEKQVERLSRRVKILPEAAVQQELSSAAVIFEGLPEVLDVKRHALARASALAGPRPIIASTTSTMMVDDLAPSVVYPERFLNAHWLNPAYLVPLVEVSPGTRTDPSVTARMKSLLERIGKVPVICAP